MADADHDRRRAATWPRPRRAATCGSRSAAPSTGFERYDDAVAAEDGDALDDPVLGHSMLYTSGTSGRPKGVLRPPSSDAALTAINLFGYDADRGDVHLCTGPLYHAAPLAFSLAIPLAFGVGVVVMESWDAADALRAHRRAPRQPHAHGADDVPPHALVARRRARAADVSSLRMVLHGAAPCPVAVKQRLIDWLGPIVWEYYAATEGTGTLRRLARRGWPVRARSASRWSRDW